MAERTWGERVRELREERGWSMDELGERCVPPATGSQINKLEKGRTQLTERWIQRLAEALQVHRLEIVEPAAKLDPRERRLVETFRGLAEDSRDTVFRVADAMPKPPVNPSKRNEG